MSLWIIIRFKVTLAANVYSINNFTFYCCIIWFVIKSSTCPPFPAFVVYIVQPRCKVQFKSNNQWNLIKKIPFNEWILTCKLNELEQNNFLNMHFYKKIMNLKRICDWDQLSKKLLNQTVKVYSSQLSIQIARHYDIKNSFVCFDDHWRKQPILSWTCKSSNLPLFSL